MLLKKERNSSLFNVKKMESPRKFDSIVEDILSRNPQLPIKDGAGYPRKAASVKPNRQHLLDSIRQNPKKKRFWNNFNQKSNSTTPIIIKSKDLMHTNH
jgi:hypothetical protein